MELFLFWFFCLGVPAIVFLILQLLRGFKGLILSSGTDIVAILLVLDATIAYDPATFASIVKSPLVSGNLVPLAVVGIFCNFIIILICILFGEAWTHDFRTRRHLPQTGLVGPIGHFPAQYMLMWMLVIAAMAAHIWLLFGDLQ